MIEFFGKGRYEELERANRRSLAAPGLHTAEPERNEWAGAWSLDFAGVQEFPYEPSLERHIVVQSGGEPGPTEKLRLLQHRLERVRSLRRLRSLVVTSAVPQEGKTVVAANLALSLADSGAQVLLIDADMRRPSLGKALGVERGPGLADCLTGAATLTEAVVRLMPNGLYFLSAGLPVDNPVNLLYKPQLAGFLQSSEAGFEWIILDTPPLIPFADAPCMGSHCDGVLLVARAGVTRPEEFERALQALKGLPLAGTVLNGYSESRQHSYYDYYSRESAGTAKTNA